MKAGTRRFYWKNCEYSERNDIVPGSSSNQMDGPNRLPKDGFRLAPFHSGTGDAQLDR